MRLIGQQAKQLRQLLYIMPGLTPMRQIKTAARAGSFQTALIRGMGSRYWFAVLVRGIGSRSSAATRFHQAKTLHPSPKREQGQGLPDGYRFGAEGCS